MPPSTCASQKFILALCLFSDAMVERLFLRPVRKLLLILLLFLGLGAGAQQAADSLRRIDSLQRLDSVRQGLSDSLQRIDSLYADSLSKVTPPIRDTLRPVLLFPFTSDSFRYRDRLFYNFTKPVRYTVSVKEWQGKEVVFYSLVGLLILFALIKNSFRRYLSDLFSSYFRTTVRQRQIKEQLLQNPLPSLLFNVFFVLSGALFLALLFERSAIAEDISFWLLTLYSAVALAVIYAGKFILLKFFGWVFQLSGATDTYIFVVFSTNKVLGILLLPFSILLAFTYGAVNAASVTLSLIVVASLFAYRFFLAYISINRQVPLNIFHFLLYLAAVEILPLLLINKLLFLFLREIS
jgi:hypothetical protein